MSVISRLRDMGFSVRSRSDWGSRHESLYQRRRETHPFDLPAKYGFAHISVTFDSGPLTGNFDADMRTVERIGFERFGSGFSYNWGIDPITGMIGEGQPLDAKGTHTVNDKGISGFPHNLNLHGHAIAILGMPGVKASEKCILAYAAIMYAEQMEGAMVKNAPLYPHSKFAAKDCPTATIRDRIPEILHLVPTMAMFGVDMKMTDRLPGDIKDPDGTYATVGEALVRGNYEYWKGMGKAKEYQEANK